MKKTLVLFLLLLLLTGCKNVETSVEENPIDSITEKEEVIIVDSTKDDIIVIEETKEEIPEGMVKSPLTGLYVDENEVNTRPIAVMLDNLYKARPQAGLSEADIVYEILAEGNITRYLAIIHTGKPETIGPVRSARPYFISKALEYDPLYVHVGGSTQALTDIINLKVPDVDALSSGSSIFWRKNHKPIPNNMYTSIEAIRKEAKRKKFDLVSDIQPIIFNDKDTDIDGSSIRNIIFPYRKNSYESEFRYNEEDKLFYRYVNNEPHLDETTKIHLSAKNIIVQYTDDKILDSEGRLEIDLIGEGKGYYLTNGKYIEVTWKKADRRARTKIYDMDGVQIKLNPGITWYQVIPKAMNVIIK